MASGHITKRGDSWRVVVDVGTDPITGTRAQLTRTVRGGRREAEAVRNALLTEIAEGRAARARATVGQLLEAWFEAIESDWSPRTALEHRRIIDKVLVPALGSKKLAKLKTSDIDAFYAAARSGRLPPGKPLAASTVRKVPHCAAFGAAARRALGVDRREPRGRRTCTEGQAYRADAADARPTRPAPRPG